MLASEIFYKIFSHLSDPEVYRLRAVSKDWKQYAEYYLFRSFKLKKQKITIRAGRKFDYKTLDLDPTAYDAKNCVIKFKPSNGKTIEIQGEAERIQILFSEWSEDRNEPHMIHPRRYNVRASIMFHFKYNASIEHLYQLPPYDHQAHYLGDKGVIMSFSYLSPTLLQIESIHTNFEWLLAGTYPDVCVKQLYPQRYQELAYALTFQGVYRDIHPYSEPVLRYIMADEDQIYRDDLLLLAVYNHTESSRYVLLLNQLKSMGIDPKVIWKYNVAKTFILNNPAGKEVEEIAKTIQAAEKEWEGEKNYVERLLPKCYK